MYLLYVKRGEGEVRREMPPHVPQINSAHVGELSGPDRCQRHGEASLPGEAVGAQLKLLIISSDSRNLQPVCVVHHPQVTSEKKFLIHCDYDTVCI